MFVSSAVSNAKFVMKECNIRKAMAVGTVIGSEILVAVISPSW